MTPFEEKLRKLYENAFGSTAKVISEKRVTESAPFGKSEETYSDESNNIVYRGKYPEEYAEFNFREKIGLMRSFHPHPTAPDRYFTTDVHWNPENDHLELVLNDPLSAKDGKGTSVLKSIPYKSLYNPILFSFYQSLSSTDRYLHLNGGEIVQPLEALYEGNGDLWVFPTLNGQGGINFETIDKENRFSLHVSYMMPVGGDIVEEQNKFKHIVEDIMQEELFPGLPPDIVKAHIEEDRKLGLHKGTLLTRIFQPKPQVLMSILPLGDAIVTQDALSFLDGNGYFEGWVKGMSIDAYIPRHGSEKIGIIFPDSVEEAKTALNQSGHKVVTQHIEYAALNEEIGKALSR